MKDQHSTSSSLGGHISSQHTTNGNAKYPDLTSICKTELTSIGIVDASLQAVHACQINDQH
jgi:hypothetical protein